MANNRLYIVDRETGAEFMLAKSMGGFWEVRPETPEECAAFVQNLQDFLEDTEEAASFGQSEEPTRLLIITENDPEYMKLRDKFRKPKEGG